MSGKETTIVNGLARVLRRNMTKEEKHLWYDFLKKAPVQFHRQKPFGNYILDFFCADARIAVELDGSQHFTEEGLKRDKERDEYLTQCGLLVLHYTNYEVKTNFEGVCRNIMMHVNARKW